MSNRAFFLVSIYRIAAFMCKFEGNGIYVQSMTYKSTCQLSSGKCILYFYKKTKAASYPLKLTEALRRMENKLSDSWRTFLSLVLTSKCLMHDIGGMPISL